MDEIDRIFATVAGVPVGYAPTIACLYTGLDLPSSCAPMLRSPIPPVDQVLDLDFVEHLTAALKLNEAVHDGAIMFGREREGADYRLVGWSYRLFPGKVATERVPNRGSAFNSCLAMSALDVVDRLYLIAPRSICRFENGSATDL